jgi:hypothetical protein
MAVNEPARHSVMSSNDQTMLQAPNGAEARRVVDADVVARRIDHAFARND